VPWTVFHDRGVPPDAGIVYREILQALHEADSHIAPEDREVALAKATTFACGFLQEIVDGPDFGKAATALSEMTHDQAATLLDWLRGAGMRQFLEAEEKLLIAARFSNEDARRLLADCRVAIKKADPTRVTGDVALASFSRLRTETCDVLVRELNRVAEFKQERQRARSRRIHRWFGRTLGATVMAAIDFSALATLIAAPAFLPVASGVAGAVVVDLADVFFHE
jgi:hypothetical protein